MKRRSHNRRHRRPSEDSDRKRFVRTNGNRKSPNRNIQTRNPSLRLVPFDVPRTRNGNNHPRERSHSASGPAPSIEAVLQSRIDSAKKRKSVAAQVEKSCYQLETRRPIVCLAFVMPLILAYEIGVIMLGLDAARGGVDQWLDYMLGRIGFGQIVLLPLVTAGIMIFWHHRLDDHWRIRWPVLTGMAVEAIGLGLILFWAANAFHLVYESEFVTSIPSIEQSYPGAKNLALAMTYIGSGIYEELFFRLMLLLPAIYWASRLTGKHLGTLCGILVVSVLFAAVHYNILNPAGAEFELSSFLFRLAASIVFCVLFLFRGFGIAVGTHVAFDLLTQI